MCMYAYMKKTVVACSNHLLQLLSMLSPIRICSPYSGSICTSASWPGNAGTQPTDPWHWSSLPNISAGPPELDEAGSTMRYVCFSSPRSSSFLHSLCPSCQGAASARPSSANFSGQRGRSASPHQIVPPPLPNRLLPEPHPLVWAGPESHRKLVLSWKELDVYAPPPPNRLVWNQPHSVHAAHVVQLRLELEVAARLPLQWVGAQKCYSQRLCAKIR